jgi:hypothetical protein
LSTAFECTLVGLAFALLLHLLSDLVQQKETDFLDECNDYCHAHVVSKLRVRPKEGNPEIIMANRLRSTSGGFPSSPFWT